MAMFKPLNLSGGKKRLIKGIQQLQKEPRETLKKISYETTRIYLNVWGQLDQKNQNAKFKEESKVTTLEN